MMMDIREKLYNFMAEEFEDAGFHENIGDDDSLFDTNILDSLSILKLLSFLDEEFDIFPEDGELTPDKIGTINLIAEYISKKLEKK
jgi:acyl carrier protein